METPRTLKQAGLALRAARLNRNLRQAELSGILGIERTQIARYETGNMPVPQPLIEQYARALGITEQAFHALAIVTSDTDKKTF